MARRSSTTSAKRKSRSSTTTTSTASKEITEDITPKTHAVRRHRNRPPLVDGSAKSPLRATTSNCISSSSSAAGVAKETHDLPNYFPACKRLSPSPRIHRYTRLKTSGDSQLAKNNVSTVTTNIATVDEQLITYGEADDCVDIDYQHLLKDRPDVTNRLSTDDNPFELWAEFKAIQDVEDDDDDDYEENNDDLDFDNQNIEQTVPSTSNQHLLMNRINPIKPIVKSFVNNGSVIAVNSDNRNMNNCNQLTVKNKEILNNSEEFDDEILNDDDIDMISTQQIKQITNSCPKVMDTCLENKTPNNSGVVSTAKDSSLQLTLDSEDFNDEEFNDSNNKEEELDDSLDEMLSQMEIPVRIDVSADEPQADQNVVDVSNECDDGFDDDDDFDLMVSQMPNNQLMNESVRYSRAVGTDSGLGASRLNASNWSPSSSSTGMMTLSQIIEAINS